MKTPAWLQRLEARIALAISKAVVGESAQAASANHSQTLNQAAIAPATSVTFQSAPFTTRTGKVRVLLFFNVNANGGTLAVGDVLQLQGVRDGGTLNPGVAGQAEVVVAHANELAGGALEISLGFDDSVVPGTHTWGGIMTVIGGHTAGADSVGRFDVLVSEFAG